MFPHRMRRRSSKDSDFSVRGYLCITELVALQSNVSERGLWFAKGGEGALSSREYSG